MSQTPHPHDPYGTEPGTPGETCAATRGAKVHDDAVTITDYGDERTARRGTRTCGRCGRPEVPVTSWPIAAQIFTVWHYAAHTIPTPEEKKP